MTLKNYIEQTVQKLQAAGVPEARANAEWIWCDVLKVSCGQLCLLSQETKSEEVSSEKWKQVSEIISRRTQREPLQYILGNAFFCGYEMEVGPGVLVPRPETELLVECGQNFMQKHLQGSVLDFCTGSGCIAICMAKTCPSIKVYGVDISEEAFQIAQRNVVKHHVELQVKLMKGDSLAVVQNVAPFDLIITNPPYIPSAEIEILEPEVGQFEPRLALDGGADGLNFYRYLAKNAGDFLKPGGVLMAEFGDNQFEAIHEIFNASDWKKIKAHLDYTKRERYLEASR